MSEYRNLSPWTGLAKTCVLRSRIHAKVGALRGRENNTVSLLITFGNQEMWQCQSELFRVAVPSPIYFVWQYSSSARGG